MSSNNLFDEESSDEDEAAKSPVKKRVIDDDDDDDESKEEDAPKRTIEMEEDDDDDDDDDEPKAKKPKVDAKKDDDKKTDAFDDSSDDDDEPKTKKVEYNPDEDDQEFDDKGAIVGSAAPKKPETKIKQARPKFMTVLESTRPPKDTTLHITKLPNLVGIQPEPFDVDTYSPELEEKEYNGYVHNMIRWRYKKDANGNYLRDGAGKLLRESNARLVTWDDGSITMHLGNEVLAVDTIDSSKEGYPGLNGYLYLSQKATVPVDDDPDAEHEPGGTVLECMGPVTSKLIPRPSSLQSEAHKALTVAVRQKTVKRARIAEYVTQEDPEKMKEEKIRQKTDLDKAQARKSSSRGHNTYRRPGMNRRYMEEEEHYDSVNIRDLKRRQFADDDDMMDYGDDDSEEDDDDVGWTKGKLAAMRGKKRQRAAKDDDDSEEEFGAAGGDDSDEEEAAPRASKAANKKRQNVFDDDDD